MGQIVNKYTIEKINQMMPVYQSSILSTPPGAIFRAKTENAVITAYKSGKVLFQGSSPEVEAGRWGVSSGPTSSEKPKKQNKATVYTPSTTLFTSNHIGSDEAGTGDYFGPITVGAVYVKQEQIQLLKEMGIKDSKNLTDPMIKKLSKEIVKLKLPYSLVILHNEKYNNVQKKGWSQGKMKAMLHHTAINHVKKKIGNAPLDGILVDQFCEPTVYQKHLRTENKSIPEKTFFMTKAESYSIAVAAASIIARTSFVNEMDKLSDVLGIELPKGASKKVDQTIAKVIREKGASALSTCAKVHFANTKKAEKYM
ncbi:ribonuclease HIII [Oceanobacillus bengalensis]|uniref:Ribonuclease HIII n=1 Tax=Oceanobacillus bengalensis TaxID=1435466 RepID=A0A494Z7J7_9BACI|nr:ribonuclease HIII [Oceanobacillus bengalensis]RKQ17986.1 ribonuclease HIII [Oceanobacillus bengalensis]